MKKIFPLIISLIIILLSLCLLEGASRIYFLVTKKAMVTDPFANAPFLQSDPIFHHRWRPSIKYLDQYRSIPYWLITNKQQFVEEEDTPLKKPANTYRIFYLGDSTTQGVVATPYKMTRIVEAALNHIQKDVHYEVINTGTSSFGMIQYYLMIKYILLKYSPDLVVIDVDMTDSRDDTVYRKFAVYDKHGDIVAVPPYEEKRFILTPQGYIQVKPFLDPPAWAYRRSAFFNLMHLALTQFYIMTHSTVSLNQDGDWLAKSWSSEVTANVNKSIDLLAKGIDILKSHGVKVMLTGVPHHGQYTGRLSPKPHEVLAELAQKEGVPYLNSYEALKNDITGSSVQQYYWSEDPTHFNIQGNLIWAKAQVLFLLTFRDQLLSPQMKLPSS